MISKYIPIPAILTDLKHYSKDKLKSYMVSGITVGIIAIPLTIALAVASGATPEAGLFTAAIAGFFCALFSGSSYICIERFIE